MPADCGEDEERLKTLAAAGTLSRNVIFGGLQPYAALPEIIRSSDICINPFELNGITRDILPTKLFQYLACARPVVATELAGTIPFLSGEEQGMVYSPPDTFVDRVGDLLDSPSLCKQLGDRGREVTTQNFEWRRIAETMVSWLNEL